MGCRTMSRRFRSLASLVAAVCLAVGGLRAENATDGLTPGQLLVQARGMFPSERMEISGTLETAEARGMNATVRPYTLTLDWSGGVPKADCRLFQAEGSAKPLVHAELTRRAGKPELALIDADGKRTEGVRLNLPVGESDLTWMDLAFDYLWWPNARRLAEGEIPEGERVSGRSCVVLEVRSPAPVPGLGAVRLWLDKATGSLLQTQQLDETGRPTRLMWVQRVGREEGRWVPRLFRIRREGMRRMTSLRVDSVHAEAFSVGKEGNP